jgi:hypothetical protein
MAVAPARLDQASRRAADWASLAKDALLAALIGGLLALPFVGLET